MAAAPVAALAPVPPVRDLALLREAAEGCRACPLWANATQTVFGAGPPRARLLLVGEQPGDVEDRLGAPFVGPAGKLLDDVLAAAAVARDEVYLTNAVKHFKWEPRGKRRIHSKPNARELRACRPWLEAEIATIAPAVIVLLGATAAAQVMGEPVRVTAVRGQALATPFGVPGVASVHPSSLLRLPDRSRLGEEVERMAADLRVAAALAGQRRA